MGGFRSALVLLGICLVAEQASAADCKIACKGSASCQIENAPKNMEIVKDRLVVYPFCENLIATNPIELRYMHGQAWFAPPISVMGPLRAVFDAYPADTPCSIPTPSCIQNHMGRLTTSFGGSPLDNRVSAPAGEGQPCALGFPCGRILIPPKDWHFRVGDSVPSGKWTVRLARGTVDAGKPEQTVGTVRGGQVTADGSWFAPGSKCVYTFVDDSGRTVASGEFAVVSRSTVENLRELARRQVAAGSSEAIAWSDTLTSNQYEWDAVQESTSGGNAP